MVVLGLVVAGAIVAGVLFSDRHHQNPGAASGSTSSPSGAPATNNIVQVEAFMVRDRPLDDPQGLPNTIDGNPNTSWHTDEYPTATFGGLYPGLGLEIQLKASGALHHLVVSTSTVGWSAQTYTAATQVTSGPGQIAAWGTPTDTKVDIKGSTTFSLAGRRGQWVLLWLTNLGQEIQPANGKGYYQASINELSVR